MSRLTIILFNEIDNILEVKTVKHRENMLGFNAVAGFGPFCRPNECDWCD